MKKTSKPFHAFLTHNWSKNQDGYNNHEIVSKVNRELQSYGLKTWFDEERMRGSIQKMMADGIEQSDVVVVFILVSAFHFLLVFTPPNSTSLTPEC